MGGIFRTLSKIKIASLESAEARQKCLALSQLCQFSQVFNRVLFVENCHALQLSGHERAIRHLETCFVPDLPGEGLSIFTKVQLILLLLLLFVLISAFAMPCDPNSISRAPDAVGHAWTRTHAKENARQNVRIDVR